MLAPSLFGVVTFLLLPILVVVWLSLHRWDLLGPIEYVGGQNWRSVLTDKTFGNSLLVTCAFVAIVVPIQTVLGLAVGALLARDLPGSGVFRTLFVLPWICVPLAIAVLWRWILAPTDGAISTLLGHRIEWLTDPGLALPVVSAVVVWTNVGYVALFFLAGILAIPAEIHSAARTDGATVMAAVLAHHAADAAADHVLRAGHRNHQCRTGFRHRLRADRRRAAGPHRPGRPPHLRRSVRSSVDRPGLGDGGGVVRHPGRRSPSSSICTSVGGSAMTSPKRPTAVLVYAGLLVGALITLAPFVLGLLTSFTSAHQFATGTPLSLPRPPTLSNYADLGGAGFGRALAVTTLMTAVILLGQVSFFGAGRRTRSRGCGFPAVTRCSGSTWRR